MYSMANLEIRLSEENKMKILKAIQIAEREWINISNSLGMCGEIGGPVGKFRSEKIEVDYRIILADEGKNLVKNLIEMDNKLPVYGYLTDEASYVFSHLATGAAKKLGLKYLFAGDFGRVYSFIRTTHIHFYLDTHSVDDPENYILKQLFFYDFFYSHCGIIDWDFNSKIVKLKLKEIFQILNIWEENPDICIRDLKNYETNFSFDKLASVSETESHYKMQDVNLRTL